MIFNFCVACGTKENLQNHHLQPKSLGGSDDKSNLITLCVKCHFTLHGIHNRKPRKQVYNIGNLIKEGKRKLKDKGLHQGGKTPFGYSISEKYDEKTGKLKLIKNEKEQKLILWIKRKHEEGKSLRKISELLKINHNKILSYQGVNNLIKRDEIFFSYYGLDKIKKVIV